MIPAVLAVVKFVTAFVPGKVRRRRLRKRIKSYCYGWQPRHYGAVGKGAEFIGPTKFNRKTRLGEWCVINGLTVAGDGEVTIGRNCQIAPEVLILTQNHDYDDGNRIPYGSEFHEKPVVIGDFVWIGQRVTILPGTVIREGAIIQAGSVVHGEIPAMSIAGGNPARPFAMRNCERFLRMKEAGLYTGGA